MMSYFQKHKFRALLLLFAIFSSFRILGFVYDGYSIMSNKLIFALLALLFTEGVLVLLIIGSLAVLIWLAIKKQIKVSFVIVWIVLTLLRLIPYGDLQTVGALLSIYQANPTQVRDDARVLLDQYEPMTYFGYFPQRPPFDQPISKDKLPVSLLNTHIGDVLVLDNSVFIEKFGLNGLFRGFVVFREGSDIWKDEPSIILQDGCRACWKIRIVDGLYWYYAQPQAEDIPTLVSWFK